MQQISFSGEDTTMSKKKAAERMWIVLMLKRTDCNSMFDVNVKKEAHGGKYSLVPWNTERNLMFTNLLNLM